MKHYSKHILLLAALMLAFGAAKAQTFTKWGPSDPSPVPSCGIYQWPPVVLPCPEVQVKQKHDHSPLPKYANHGWDTAVTCQPDKRNIILTCMPYIPVQYFNGQYTVDAIPFDPPTNFYIDHNQTADANNPNNVRLDINCDDIFAVAPTQLGFPFYFFGKRKTQFRLGDNGMVTFTTNAIPNDGFRCNNTKPYCPFSFSGITLPFQASNTPEGSQYSDRMHDAIFGVYEDTYPTTSTVVYPQGIYYGVIGERPCRKIIASWNEIPQYNNTAHRDTYMMVCYEGSNMIEVHVKKHWPDKPAIIGILNENGNPQQQGPVGSITNWVEPNALAAYYPAGKNNFSGVNIEEQSWRFTPQGETFKEHGWYIIRQEGDSIWNDTLPYAGDPNINELTDSYQELMAGEQEEVNGNEWNDAPCPTLTKAYIKGITEPTKVVYFLNFKNAEGEWYNLADTVFIGVDQNHDLALRDVDAENFETVHDYCAGQPMNFSLDFSELSDTAHMDWHVYRILHGVQTELPLSVLDFGNRDIVTQDTLHRMMFTLNLPDDAKAQNNRVDSILIQASVDFTNGCDSNATLLIRISPNFNIHDTAYICHGGVYYWPTNGKAYRSEAEDSLLMQTVAAHCDSLRCLRVFVVDTNHTYDPVISCKPYTWLNGITYEQTNVATRDIDTIILSNRGGCDSIVHLDFTYMPLNADIRTSLSSFTLDQMEVELTDISEGATNRTWLLPDGNRPSSIYAYYTIPYDSTEAHIWLVAESSFGNCVDTAFRLIPFNKESVYLPNAFTPENTTDNNNLFGAVTRNALTQEMLIYNRRGELVYQCAEVDCTWDGRDLNGQACPQGSYVYIIRYTDTFEPDRTHVLRGTVTLIR